MRNFSLNREACSLLGRRFRSLPIPFGQSIVICRAVYGEHRLPCHRLRFEFWEADQLPDAPVSGVEQKGLISYRAYDDLIAADLVLCCNGSDGCGQNYCDHSRD